MGAIDPNKVFSVPVRLVIAPTLAGMQAATYPYGATTTCGAVKFAFIRHMVETGEILDRAKGTVIGGWQGVERIFCGFDLQQYDIDVIALMYSKASSGSGFRSSHAPGIQTPGGSLLFAPYDEMNKPAAIVYAPTPATPTQRFDFYTKTRLNPRWLFRCPQNSSGNEFLIDYIQNLVTS
jgi:hypothetical protein